MDSELGRQVGSILLVFALLAGALWLIRRRGGVLGLLRRDRRRRVRSLTTIERLALTPQHAVHLLHLEIQGEAREILLATHPQGCTVLDSASSSRELFTGRAQGIGA